MRMNYMLTSGVSNKLELFI